jgi:hypothetical protein
MEKENEIIELNEKIEHQKAFYTNNSSYINSNNNNNNNSNKDRKFGNES